mmetsp:Transcript_31532/g.65854  ORF Transcript_31532/g.65854 Transcript_31532/m.65854 type:complete len:106 (-) Transcript_31532:333-650(-)|eukprot:CAMPEP_0172448876 /NCGR_PEP_ID=MMETSP1065-20121228/7781_1 /TAXON_ID=265537 /ORGANISM="Amphiprora paludosa, Strain CCMP125" /LENGTH=105 /DNA_ID=CAMNT_0013200467 /DNA_START=312 /DNA_END=629 /DNA_ORIENTATION=+
MVLEMALSTLAVTAVILFQAVVYLTTKKDKTAMDSVGEIDRVSTMDSDDTRTVEEIVSLVLDDGECEGLHMERKIVARMLSQTGSEMMSSCRSIETLVQEQLEED